MATVKRDNRLTRSQSFLCVGFAGVFSKTVTSPLEVVKILSQVGTFHCKRGFINSFLLLYNREGLRAFWKGNSVSCLRLFPYSAIHLGTYKKIVHLHMDELGRISQWRAIVAGGLAGISAALLTYPLEVVETRLIAQNCRESTYKGVLHALSSIYQKEGFLALYRGFSLTILGAVPFSIGCYVVYINLDKLWQEHHFRFSSFQNFINGCLAAGVAQTLSFPFETIKRKMQAQSPFLPHCGGVDVHFTGMVNCFKEVIKTKGMLSLWSGFTANTVKVRCFKDYAFSSSAGPAPREPAMSFFFSSLHEQFEILRISLSILKLALFEGQIKPTYTSTSQRSRVNFILICLQLTLSFFLNESKHRQHQSSGQCIVLQMLDLQGGLGNMTIVYCILITN